MASDGDLMSAFITGQLKNMMLLNELSLASSLNESKATERENLATPGWSRSRDKRKKP